MDALSRTLIQTVLGQATSDKSLYGVMHERVWKDAIKFVSMETGLQGGVWRVPELDINRAIHAFLREER